MDALIETGQTKAQGDTTLVSKSLTSELGEQVFVLLQVDAEGVAARGFQKECLDIIKTALLETDGETAARLDSTLKELNGLIKGLLLSKTIKDMHAIIAVVDSKTTLHVSHAGRAEAYVVRGGTASQITEYTRGKSSPAFVHIASGQLEPRDTILLSTQRLLRTVTPAQLAQLSLKPESILSELKGSLEAEKEEAAFAMLQLSAEKEKPARAAPPIRSRGRGQKSSGQALVNILEGLSSGIQKGINMLPSKKKEKVTSGNWAGKISSGISTLRKDLRDPNRKRKAHLILIAGILAIFLILWAGTNLISFSQNSQSKAELKQLVEEINGDIKTAENRRLTGDTESANAILKRAEERTKELMDNERGFFRKEAMEIFGRIQSTREEINNLVRISPRAVNLTVRKPSIMALGFIGLGEEEFIVFDRQDLYRVINNQIDDPDRLSEEELILDGVNFPRYQTNVFQMTGNGITEIISGQATTMKTDDPAGWITGTDMKAYLRYLYVLSPENNQIYKYERLSNRYSEPVEYNINGNLEGALDMAIDGNVYILKEGGEVVKLLRGEQQPFAIRNLPNEDTLNSATKVFKVIDGHTYFLDPVRSRVIITTDGGSSGEAVYLKQYVLEGEEIGELKDIYVDPDESRLYVLGEKRLYKVDLTTM